MSTLFWALVLVVLALVLFVMSIQRVIRAEKDIQFINRIEKEIGWNPPPRSEMRMTEEQIKEMHRSRWDGD